MRTRRRRDRAARVITLCVLTGTLGITNTAIAPTASATSCVEPTSYAAGVAKNGGSVYVGEVVAELSPRDGRRYWEVSVERALAGSVDERVVVSAEVVELEGGESLVVGAEPVELRLGPIFVVDSGNHHLAVVCSGHSQENVAEHVARYEPVLRAAGLPPGEVRFLPVGQGGIDPTAQADDVDPEMYDGAVSTGAAALMAGGGVLGGLVLGGGVGYLLARRGGRRGEGSVSG